MHTDAYLQHHTDRTTSLQRSARSGRHTEQSLRTGVGSAARHLGILRTARPRAPLPARPAVGRC